MTKYLPGLKRTHERSAVELRDHIFSVIFPYVLALGGTTTYRRFDDPYRDGSDAISDIEIVGDRGLYAIYIEADYWEFNSQSSKTDVYVYGKDLHDIELVEQMIDAFDVLMDDAKVESWR